MVVGNRPTLPPLLHYHSYNRTRMRLDRGVIRIAKKTQIDLSTFSEGTQNDTLYTRDLVGKTFTLNSIREVSTGSIIGELTLDGEEVEAWLDGARVRPAVLAMSENEDLPRSNLTVNRLDSYGEPFVILDA